MAAKDVKKVKAWAFTISGTFRNAKKEPTDFEGISGVIPYCDKEFAEAMIRVRMAPMLIQKSSKVKDRIHSAREVWIDHMAETEAAFSFLDKDIKEMSYEELQDLAIAKDLRAIPLYKKAGLRHTRMMAYVEFSWKVLGIEIDYKREGYRFEDEKPLVVTDSIFEKNTKKSISNEEMLDLEQRKRTVGSGGEGNRVNITREELEKMANERNIPFHEAITDEKLYIKVFNA